MTKNIYWAVVRNQAARTSYIELTHIKGTRWVAVLDEHEFRFRSRHTEFLSVLIDALAVYQTLDFSV